jgi:opacity protein-like surface antigen
MKRLFCTAFLLASALPAFAQEPQGLPAAYVEMGVGAVFAPSLSTKTYTLTSGTTTATGKVNLNYDTGFTAGAEAGYAGVGIPEIRLGVSYDYLQGKFSDGQVVGTVNGTPGSFPFTRADLTSLGAGSALDNDVHVLMGNAYYSFPMLGPIRPYLGAGLGAAFISNAGSNFAFSASAGFRVELTDESYMGLRYRFYDVQGPTDDLGIKYESLTAHSVMAVLGMYLN